MAEIANPERQSQMVETLRKSEERLRQLFESIPNAIVTVNHAGLIEMVNMQAERLFGYPRRELLGCPVEMLMPERFRGHHIDQRTSFFANPRARHMGGELDLYGLRKDGSEFPVEIGLNSVATEEGDLVMSAIVDVSDHKEKEEDFGRTMRRNDLLLREVHHRVKNNLQVIDSFLGLQSMQTTDPDVIAVFRNSQNRIRSMALIHQALYQSKETSEVDFAEIINTLTPILMSSYNLKSDCIKLLVDTTPVTLPTSSAIPCGLIVNELMSNALKHAFPDVRRGTIELRLTTDDQGHIVLSFSDDGVGIPAELDLDNPGTLGLQLIALLANQLHGALRIDRSDPTRFVLRFPQQQ